MTAAALDRMLVCPFGNGPEAAIVAAADVAAPESLVALINHLTGRQALPRPDPVGAEQDETYPDLADVRGQLKARRALEIAAAGGHNLLMIGPPGVGKSMLASRLPGILPPLSPQEALELSMVRSVDGTLAARAMSRLRPFIRPHHSASMPALVGGGRRAGPGQISLAHHGVLFMDELAEFARAALQSVGYQTRDLLEAMQDDWGSADSANILRVDGGMSANDWTMQFLSDILGVPVDRPKVVETTTLGAAWLAGSRAGLYPDREEFSKIWALDRQFTPSMDEATRERLYKGWKNAVSRTLGAI